MTKKRRILVLMSTYNGEKYIRELIESLIEQESVNVDILIRDDESSDKTIDIVKTFESDNINIYLGKNMGYAKSFWDLVIRCDDSYDYYAFCDQDDIWMKDKLISAISMIEKEKKGIPVLYTSDVIPVDSNCHILSKKLFKNSKVLSFYESLTKSILPGCTFVMNQECIRIAKLYNGYLESHDWAMYCIAAAFGKILYDETSHIYYRIHNANTIGKNSWMKNQFVKFKRFFKKSKCSRSRFAKDFYECYKDSLPMEYSNYTYLFGYYKEKSKKAKLIFNNNTKGLILRIMIFFGKV